MSLTEHIVLAEEAHGFFINWDKGRELTQSRITDFNIHGTPASPVESLSGGNQQRALLALLREPLITAAARASDARPGYRVDHLYLVEA